MIWTSTYPNRLKSIYMLEKKILRVMTFSTFRQETRPLFENLGILNIYELNTYCT